MLMFIRLLWRKALGVVLAMTIFFSIAFNSAAIAETKYENAADIAKTAAERIVEQDGVKEMFGKSESGDELLDSARVKANKKLKSLADKAENSENRESLPHSERLFLRNLEGNN